MLEEKQKQLGDEQSPGVATCSIYDPVFDPNDSRTWKSTNGGRLPASIYDKKEGDE